MTNIDELLQDIDERARVAYLELERKCDLKKYSDELRDTFRLGFIAGYKAAIYHAVRMATGEKP
jgi:hypothetical protein